MSIQRRKFEKWWVKMVKDGAWGDSYKQVAWAAWKAALNQEKYD